MSSVPIVLFGAFDRHNLGDILLGRAAALTAGPRPCLFAGLKAADLTEFGGFAVAALADVLAGWGERFGDASLELVHVGGEVLDTDAWEAAVMLLDPEEASRLISRLDACPAERLTWAAEFLATSRPAPYVVGRDELPAGARVEFRAVGGVGMGRREGGFSTAIRMALKSADRISVRDRRSQSALAGLGIRAGLVPDPVTALGPWLRWQITGVPPLAGSYLAVQCAATFGDDATLAALAAALDRLGMPVLLFRAGAAPWHDDPEVYGRLVKRLRVPARILESLHVRDIAAAIGGARCCIASSLHALLVTGILGVPAQGLERQPGEGEKLRAYGETWGVFSVQTPESLGRT